MVLIVLIEVLVVLLIALTSLLSLHLLRKKRRIAAVNQLIDDISDSQAGRKQKLSAKLCREFKLSNQSALVLCDVLMAAEKKFLQQYIEQELTESVGGFYDNLCVLLESYLQVMAEGADHAELSGKSHPSQGEDASEEDLLPERVSSIFGEQPPEWGDVFD